MSKQSGYILIDAGHAVARSQSLDYALRDDLTVPEAVRTVALDAEALDDEWFGAFDESAPIDFIEDEPTSPWQRFSDWVRNFKRAA